MKNYILLISIHADAAMPPGYDEWGGTHAYMKELLDIFSKRNIQCILITRKTMRFLPDHEHYSSCCDIIRLINGKDEPMSKLELFHYHEENINKISEIINTQETLPQIIHSVYWNSGRLAMELSAKFQIPYVHSVISNSMGRVARGAIEPLAHRAFFEKQIYDNALYILCVSEDEKSDLLNYYNVSPNKLIVCGQFISDSFVNLQHDVNGFPYINAQISENEQQLIAENYNQTLQYKQHKDNFWIYKAFTYFGRMDSNKGITTIVKAWEYLFKKYGEICPQLWMIGGSIPEIDQLRQKLKKDVPQLEDYEKHQRIVWWGYMNAEGISTILLKTQVVIMHSLYEPGGRVVAESLMAGLPVIATPYGFAKDIIKDWNNGFLVNYNDFFNLVSRLEHFIRQPLLGNALRENAIESAKYIMKTWKFEENHLFAYGLSDKPQINEKENTGDSYSHKFISIFPYHSSRLSNEYICNSFQLINHEKVITIEDLDVGTSTSIIKEIRTNKNRYIVKRMVPRLATSPLFNPFLKHIIARDAQKHFEIETNMYLRRHTQVFIGKDDFHHLIFLKKLFPLDTIHSKYLQNCIEYLTNRKNVLKEHEKQIYINILVQKYDSYNEIENILYRLNHEIPVFYFECSGMFSNALSWAIAPYILEYNKHLLKEKYNFLNDICKYFKSISDEHDFSGLRDINIDIKKRHLMSDGTNIYLIDHEKSSIGYVEMDIASFLYDYYIDKQDVKINNFRDELIPYFYKNHLDEKVIWSAFAYRIYYNIVVDAVVLHHNKEDNLKLLLEVRNIIERL